MVAMVDPISVIFSNRFLTFTAFRSWGVRLFCGGSEAWSWTPHFGHLRRSCSGSKLFEGCQIFMDPSNFELGGHVFCQGIRGIVPT
jgi:hypothetical protein